MWTILNILKEFLHWQRIRAELAARKELHNEYERLADEVDELEDEISRSRAAGLNEHADRLLERKTRSILYRIGLPSADEGSDVRGPEGHDLGNGVRDPA